jgi:integrase
MSQRLFKVIKNYTDNNEYEFVDLLDFISNKVMEDSPKDKTIATRYSLIKKFLRSNYPELTEKQLKLVRPDEDITLGILQNDEIVKTKKKNIHFDKELVDKILDLKLTDDIYELAIYLQFISGLRANELRDKDFKIRIKDDNVRMMLSKKKDNKKNKYYPINLIPNTLNAKEFKNGLVQIRAFADLLKPTDWIKRINRVVKKQVRKDLTSHALRGMYASYMFNNHNPDNQNLNGYISKVLNHENGDSSLNYSNYIYENGFTQVGGDNEEVIEEIEEDKIKVD